MKTATLALKHDIRLPNGESRQSISERILNLDDLPLALQPHSDRQSLRLVRITAYEIFTLAWQFRDTRLTRNDAKTGYFTILNVSWVQEINTYATDAGEAPGTACCHEKAVLGIVLLGGLEATF